MFSIKTSVSETLHAAKAVFFPMRLKNVGLRQLAKSCWGDTALEQEHCIDCVSNLLDYFRFVINNEVKGIEEMTI